MKISNCKNQIVFAILMALSCCGSAQTTPGASQTKDTQSTKPATTPTKTETPSPVTRPIPLAKAMELGRKYSAEFLTGDATKLWPLMSDEMQKAMKEPGSLKAFQGQIATQLGQEKEMLDEYVLPAMPDLSVYVRRSTFTNFAGKFVTTFAFTSTSQIGGFRVTPEKNAAESTYLSYQTKTKLQLPFKGEWVVYQGGRSVTENYHAEFANQRFAYDLTMVKNDSLWKDDPEKLESFYAFGQTVLAPGDGKVIEAEDLYEDNPVMKPSSTNPNQGNNIVIDHGNGEYSMLAHLKHGSVKVKTGDTVKAGQEIAQCGNSGNSPFPHLHYHMQTAPNWFVGDGLPTLFLNIVINRKNTSGEPFKGQFISNQ